MQAWESLTLSMQCTPVPASLHMLSSQAMYHPLRGWCMQADLVVAQPNSTICHRERNDMVQEGFRLLVALWCSEYLREHLFQQLQVWLAIKCLYGHGCE